MTATLHPPDVARSDAALRAFQGREVDVIAATQYGVEYACAVQRDNIFGVQFHPEKSQAVGLQILKNFVEAV